MPKVDLSEHQYCPESGKRRFKTEVLALRRATLAQRSDKAKAPRSVYRCEVCGDWHITKFVEYHPRVDDGTATREIPNWKRAFQQAAEGKIVTRRAI